MSKIRFRNRAELSAALASGAFKGRAMHMMVFHDDRCTPSRCTCEPEFELEELTPEAYEAGQRAQDEWVRSKQS